MQTPTSGAPKLSWVRGPVSLRSRVRGLVGSPGNLVVLGSLGGVRLVNTVLRTSAGSTSLMEPAPDIFLVYPLLLAMSPLFLRVRRSLWR